MGWRIFTPHADWNFYAMRVALLTSFAASRKEPLGAMMDRVHQGFLDSGLPAPFTRGGSRLEIRIAPGNHDTMVRQPNIQILIEELRGFPPLIATQEYWRQGTC